MAKSLVIVESPAKAKTINKYLGSDYIVRSSMGHIRDLPTSAAGRERNAAERLPRDLSAEEKEAARKARDYRRLVNAMAVDPENGWKAVYSILPGKTKVLKELKNYARDAQTIYLATDLDREGEAIAWHLREAIGGDPERYRRVTFSEITKRAIQEAFAHPGELNMARVHAQQTRRFLDRVVGFMLSPLLWKKVARGLSAGRVQSVAVRLVVEREREIDAFVPEEYWKIAAQLRSAAGDFTAQVAKQNGRTFRPAGQDEAKAALALLRRATYRLTDREDRPTKQRPFPPFITTTMQQAAAVRLGFSVKKTMLMAQRLYEAGHITYMRTDSTHLSPIAVESCRRFVKTTYGDRYCPATPPVYSSRKGAQEAHEAIRPTDVDKTPDKMSALERDEARLYELIWRRFVASQMAPAEFDTTALRIQAGDFELRANGRVMRFDGWTRVLPMQTKSEDEVQLPNVQPGEELELIELLPSQHFTKPPARYTEASLVKELERLGIGRPSTYAPIISTIQERGYVELIKKRFYAQKIGDIVTDRLVRNFTDLMDYGFTAGMEQDLDKIAAGESEWRRVLDEFYRDFRRKLDRADETMQENDPVPVGLACPSCGRDMQIRTARTGVFLGCSGYQLPAAERCTKTINLIPGEESEAIGKEEEAEARALLNRRRCSICTTAMDAYLIDETKKLHVCGKSPDCPGFEIETGRFKLKGYDGPVIVCDKCGAEMQLKSGRFGKYFGCTGYPDCKNTRKLMRTGQPAPPKMDPVPMPELKCQKSDAHFVLRDGAAGLFLAAHTFPRSRETRSVRVSELYAHRDQIDEKYRFIVEGPQQDPDGNDTVVRFKRKEKIHVLSGWQNDQPSKWEARHSDGKWEWNKARSR
ncbi:type I DNA topoisomerase [candidate division KSB1 bacterium]|nr:type I DNA topoisomerase [candidate division KSB1 bacterium]